MCSPGFSSDSAYQVTYIVRGSGPSSGSWNQWSTGVGDSVEGWMLVHLCRGSSLCQRLLMKMAWSGSPSSPHPRKTSVWKALSPQVLQASFNVSPELEKLFRSKRISDAIFFPPPPK
ncbi:Glutelin type-A 1 [Cinnamomum micranthum f. kanehirae]|uniref:Glutelin type-A 1 n=1 Tax=Cinnamomum micranthum f. kanehirae TaxID=337451 RepID=A0A3S3N6D0_9MAGN|nr:Glutelin type-A 1 [Cinnamomum micranthum f. kanehirae]